MSGSPAVVTRFLYSGAQMIGEYDAGGTLLRRYVPGPGLDQPIAWYEGSGTTDRRGLIALNLVRFADEESKQKLHWRLFEVHQLGLMKNHVGALEQAKSLIDDLTSKPSLTPNERYFLVFAQWYGQVAFARLYASQPLPQNLKFDLNLFSLGDVSPRWKRTFPMPIHPDWDDSKPAAKQGASR